jgi:cell wall-associated NlpC family hydrolase
MKEKPILSIIIILIFFISCASLKESAQNKREVIVRYAKNFLNKKYRYGVQDPHYGFDCSGLVQYAYKEAGINIPRTAKEQYARSKKINKNELELGDLVFFSIENNEISHVGIYVGNNKFIHSPSSGKNVRIDELSNPYWEKVYAGCGTYLK